MGLSNEERYRNFFNGVRFWRTKMHEFVSLLAQNARYESADSYSGETRVEVARGWVRELDRMVGSLIVGKTNKNTGYWLFGEGDHGFKSFVADTYLDLYDADNPSLHMPEPEHDSIGWWENEADYEMAAQRLQWTGVKHDGLDHLGRWWDLYAYFSSLTYSIHRYDDELFPADLRERFELLVGEMVNRRYEVCFGAYHDPVAVMERETLLLLKHEAFHELLKRETKTQAPGDYFKKEFDGYALWEHVAKMTRKDLKALFEERRAEKDKWTREYHAEQNAKDKGKLDGLTGILPPAPEPVPAPKKRKGKKS